MGQDTTHNTQLCLAYINLKMHKLFVLNVLILVFRTINCDQSSKTYEAKILSQRTQNNEYGTHMPAYVKDMMEKLEMRNQKYAEHDIEIAPQKHQSASGLTSLMSNVLRLMGYDERMLGKMAINMMMYM